MMTRCLARLLGADYAWRSEDVAGVSLVPVRDITLTFRLSPPRELVSIRGTKQYSELTYTSRSCRAVRSVLEKQCARLIKAGPFCSDISSSEELLRR